MLAALELHSDLLRGRELNGVEAILLGGAALGLLPAVGGGFRGRGERAGIAARLAAGVGEIEVEQVLVASEHLRAELLLREAPQTHIGHGGVLAYAALAEEVGYGGAAAALRPPLYHVGRVVDVLEVEEGLVGELLERLEVVVLVGEPVGVHLPEHPLARHLEEARAAPGIAEAVGLYLRLEGVAQLVGEAVELAVLYAVGGHPQRADEVVVGAAVGRALERVVEHDEHLVGVGLGAGPGELERVAEEGVEALHAALEVGQVHCHRVAVELRGLGHVAAEALLPEEHEVVRLRRVAPAPAGGVARQVILPQVVRDVYFLLRHRARRKDGEHSH